MRILALSTSLVFTLPTFVLALRYNNLDHPPLSAVEGHSMSTDPQSSATVHVRHGHETANPIRPPGWPGALPLDVDGYPTAPDGLELQQVHIYVRHGVLYASSYHDGASQLLICVFRFAGERTPVGIRMSDPPASIPEHWMLCKTARRFKAAVTSSWNASGREFTGDDETLPVRKVVERADGRVVDGECLLGELTDIGRQTTYSFGHALRRLYVEKLGFLPDTVTSDNEAYFRTTNIPRTTESLEQIVHGLYPTEKCAYGFVPRVRIRNGKDENLFGNTLACKRLEILQIGFAQAAAQTWNTTLEPLDAKLSKYIGGNPVRLDGKPRASGILDTVKAATAHNIQVPSEFKEKSVIDVIERAVVQEWFGGYKTEEVRRLGMGRLLSDLSKKMSTKAEKGADDPMKILVHSTHDTALAGLCSTLDVFDERWPAFSAAITFELFRKRTTEDFSQRSVLQTVLSPFRQPKTTTEHFVRMRYQNRNMVLPICSEDGKHLPGSPELCTLDAFRERVKELTPVEWEKELPASHRLAASPEFDVWKAEACVVDFGLEWTPPSNVIDSFNSLSTVQLPSDLAYYKPDKLRDSDMLMSFLRDLQNWSKDQGGPEKTSKDRYRITARLPDLVRVFVEIRHHWSKAKSDDATMRSVDALLELVFNDVSYLSYSSGHTLRLCETDRVGAVRTPADRLLTLQCPKLSCTLMKQAKLDGTSLLAEDLEEAAWEDTGSFRSIIALPMEYRRRDEPLSVAPNQIVLDLVTAQNQRRALGLPARALYGMVYHDGALRVYSAWWIDGFIHIYFHNAFMIVMQREFMSAYCFLHNLRDSFAELQDELEKLDVLKALHSIQANSWRAQVQQAHPIRVRRGPDEELDCTVDELEEDYTEDDDRTDPRGSPVVVHTPNIPHLKRAQQGGLGPPSLVDMLKQWVKSVILYYLGVLAGLICQKLG
ncbi:hypothetical protein EUX98_g3181 [Antrodiella citrinella]|uniref:Uncharacterized protein n=1 Tax=Antrodiella citrinella TaxID=2447956 RepID=A0A4S4MZZ6_9APHY|nr:hypothetical protein EUX98_g3181 [Antrodiella citrinella]